MSGFVRSYRWLLLLAGGLLVLGVLAAVVYEPEQGEDTGPILRTASNRPSGARALMIWLADQGFRTERIALRQFSVDPDTRALFVLQPTQEFAADEIDEIARWVERGGVLILAAHTNNALMHAFEVRVSHARSGPLPANPLHPVLLHPPIDTTQVSGVAWLDLRDPAWAPLLAAQGDPDRTVLAARHVERGVVFALSDPRLFSNSSIGEADNAAVVLNLLAGVPPGSVVAFDEYHQGLTEHGTLTARLTREPWGWAIILVAVVLFCYLALSGRRFGRAITPAPTAALRSRAEYVATMGALLRRGQHHDWLRRQFATHVKRDLGARYRVRADQPAMEFAAAIAARGGDGAALGPLLARLEAPHPLAEHDTIALIRDVDTLRKRMTGAATPDD